MNGTYLTVVETNRPIVETIQTPRQDYELPHLSLLDVVAAASPLPAMYYLDNFALFLGDVAKRYSHLLNEQELGFYASFKGLPRPAQCLYVRLASRKGPLFRRDKLTYGEIPCLDSSAALLAEAGLLAVNPPLTLMDLLNLFTLPELKQAFPGYSKNLRRPELLEAIRAAEDAEQQVSEHWYARVQCSAAVLQPLHADLLECYRLLFFGNLDQDLTEFVLSDLGLVTYEKYALDGAAAAFRSRHELDQLHAAIVFRRQVEQQLDQQVEPERLTGLLELARDFNVPEFAPARRVYSKGLNSLARQLEREGHYLDALELFRQSTQVPARERVARILYGQENYQAARDQCELILQSPWDEQESTCAERIRQRCVRRLNQPSDRHKLNRNKPMSIVTDRLTLAHAATGSLHNSVESIALAHLTSTLGAEGAYVENWLLNTLFGLTFWDAVFAPVEDAFYHPFQRGPRDLYDSRFKSKRRALIASRLEAVLDSAEFDETVLSVWQAKFGIANPFVGWTAPDEPLLAKALDRIPGRHLHAIFERMLVDLRNHCSGFPDLILFHPCGAYELVEVKGPGDRLQDHQKRWLEFFALQGIRARVVHVDFE